MSTATTPQRPVPDSVTSCAISQMNSQPVVGSSSSTAPGTGKAYAIWVLLSEWRDGRLLQVFHVSLTDRATVTFEPFNASEPRR